MLIRTARGDYIEHSAISAYKVEKETGSYVDKPKSFVKVYLNNGDSVVITPLFRSECFASAILSVLIYHICQKISLNDNAAVIDVGEILKTE